VQYAFAGIVSPRWIRRDIKRRLSTRSIMTTADDRSSLMQSGRKAQSDGALIANKLRALAREKKGQRRSVDRKHSRYATLRYILLRKVVLAHEKQRKKMRLANSRRKQGSVSLHPNISRDTSPNIRPQQEIEAPQTKRALDNPAWKLFNDCSDSEDPVKEWLKRLGIPCSVSVVFDNQNNGRSNASHTTSGIATGASRSILSGAKKGKNKRKPKVSVKTMDGDPPPPPR
jgi:hypothetical protein